MEDVGQISLPIDLEKEILEEDKIRLKEEENMVEALLFSLGRSVSVEEIAVCLNMGKDGATLAAERLRERYEERQEGLIIKKLEDRYQMMSHPKTYEGLIRVVKSPRKPALSDVALETLSIIAYCQPITKVEIERIRGVKSDPAVNRLVEFGLIEEVGRLDAPGRPMLFATTEEVAEELKDGFGLEAEEEETDAEENSMDAEEETERTNPEEEETDAEENSMASEEEIAGVEPESEDRETEEEDTDSREVEDEDTESREEVKEEANAESPET